MTIEPHASLHAYFFEEVRAALTDLEVRASDLAAWYVVRLLADNARVGASLDDEPLALRYVRSQQAPVGDKARRLQEVGDAALTVSGFFGESLREAPVDVGYYANLGSAAYQQAGGLLRVWTGRRDLAEVLGELAEGFDRFRTVLSKVAEASLCASGGLTQVFDRWLRTRSPDAEGRLIELGLVLPRGDPGRN